jgi:hypothetical protein
VLRVSWGERNGEGPGLAERAAHNMYGRKVLLTQIEAVLAFESD